MDIQGELSNLCRNAVDVVSKEEFEARLLLSRKSKKPLRIKAGFDPSAPDIHLGHTVLLRKLREFQDFGHKVIFIIGDYTAMIGDPTGQTKTRPALSQEEVEKNAKTYQAQAFKILDSNPSKIEIVRNSSWLDKLSLRDFLENVATRFTLAQIIQRDDFQKRMAEKRPITFPELNYPLIQAYDSVMVKADIEIGGTDQLFNLLAGRDLQPKFNQEPQIVMTMPLLVGLDGTQKMSKSLGNYIGLTDSPKDVFGKSMSVPDSLMAMYFNLLTNENGDEIQKRIVGAIHESPLHPRDAKVKLAKLLTEFVHGKEAAEKEAEEFKRVFSEKQRPDNAPIIRVPNNEINIVNILVENKVAASASAARRLIEQGAISVDDQKILDPKLPVQVKDGSFLKAGKKSFFEIKIRG